MNINGLSSMLHTSSGVSSTAIRSVGTKLAGYASEAAGLVKNAMATGSSISSALEGAALTYTGKGVYDTLKHTVQSIIDTKV